MPQDTLQSQHDAQRTLEQKALRNVRSLVDRIENERAAQGARTVRFILGSVLVALVVALAAFFLLTSGKTRQAPIVSPAKSTAPAAPAPPRT